MKLEAHDGFVDAANLLDGQSSITDALAIEQHELRKHPEEDAIRHARNADGILGVRCGLQETDNGLDRKDNPRAPGCAGCRGCRRE